MDRAIYTAMGAANAALNRQAVTSNNLANTSTTGFRAQLMAYRSVPVNGPGVETRALVTESTPYHDNLMGMINHTGRDLDVALPQNGWLSVETTDGSEAYTRAGNIQVDADGQLSVRGFALMGDGGPIAVPPQSEITLAPDGTISVLGAGDEPSAMAQVGRLKLVNAEIQAMRMGDDGLFYADAGQLAADLEMKLIPGAVESSNVSPVKSMVDLIASARNFDMQMKVISSVDENARASNQLLTIA